MQSVQASGKKGVAISTDKTCGARKKHSERHSKRRVHTQPQSLSKTSPARPQTFEIEVREVLGRQNSSMRRPTQGKGGPHASKKDPRATQEASERARESPKRAQKAAKWRPRATQERPRLLLNRVWRTPRRVLSAICADSFVRQAPASNFVHFRPRACCVRCV